METRRLGRTGLEVTRLGFGLAGISTGERRGEDISGASRVLEAVLDAGINFLDTAAGYGNTEELIGKTIAHRRDEYVLATKFGLSKGAFSAATTVALGGRRLTIWTYCSFILPNPISTC